MRRARRAWACQKSSAANTMPPHSPALALPRLIVPNGVGTVTAGWDGQLLVNAKPFTLGRNGFGSAIAGLLNRGSADPRGTPRCESRRTERVDRDSAA